MSSKQFLYLCLALLIFFGTAPAFAQGIFEETADWGTAEYPPQQGDFKVPGDVTFSDGTYTIEGNGNDIWGNSDEGFYVYTTKEGSWSLSGKLDWVETGGNEWAKITTMVRDSAAADSKTYYANLRGGSASEGDRSDAAWRDNTGGSSGSTQIFVAQDEPLTQNDEGVLYQRVTYDAVADFAMYEYSVDGTEWVKAHMRPIDFGTEATFGFAVTNHDDNEVLARADVSEVELVEFEGGIFASRSTTHEGHFGVSSFYKPGDEFDVNVNLVNSTINPIEVTIEETVPTNFSASNISDGGTESGGVISWTVEVPGGEPGEMTLSYTLTASEDADGSVNLNGNMDGVSIPASIDSTSALNLVGPAIDIFEGSTDVGSVDASGYAEMLGENLIIGGSGADIWGGADEFFYAFKEVEGSFSLRTTMFLFPLDGDPEWVKGGIMVRDSLSANSANGFAMMRTDGDIRLQYRPETGAESANLTAVENSEFIYTTYELMRLGDNVIFNAFDADGNMIEVGELSIPMEGSDFVGFAITSHTDGNISEAEFENTEFIELDGFANRVAETKLIPDGGGVVEGIQVVVTLDEGKTSSSTIVEELPSGVTAVNIETTNGSASFSGGELTWDLDGATGSVEMTYDLEVDASAAGSELNLNGYMETSGKQVPMTGDDVLYPASYIAFEIPFSEAQATLDGMIAEGEYDVAYSETFSHEEGDTEAPGVHISGTAYPADEQNATFHTFHDSQYLYVAIDVVDPVLDFTSGTNDSGTIEAWRNDSTELYLDGNLSRSTTYENNALGPQMTVMGDGSLTGGTSAPSTTEEIDNGAVVSNNPDNFWNFAARVKDDGSGYIVEYQVDKTQVLDPISRRIIGFDIMMNDGANTGGRDANWAYWNMPPDGDNINDEGNVISFWNNETGKAFVELVGGTTNVSDWSLF